MTTNRYVIRWTGPSQRQSQVQFNDSDGLLAALDRVTCDAIEAQASLRADLYTSPTVMDPLLIQFTVGHPSLATLLWHLDGESLVAADLRRPNNQMHVVPDQVDGMPWLDTSGAVHPLTVRQALVVYVLTGERADALRWTALCQD